MNVEPVEVRESVISPKLIKKMLDLVGVKKPEKMTNIECPASTEVDAKVQKLTYYFPPKMEYFEFNDDLIWTIAEMIPEAEGQKNIIALCLYKKGDSRIIPDAIRIKEVCIITIPTSLDLKEARTKIRFKQSLKTTPYMLRQIMSFVQMTQKL